MTTARTQSCATISSDRVPAASGRWSRSARSILTLAARRQLCRLWHSRMGSGLLAAPQLVVPGAAGRGLVNLTSLQLLAVPAVSGSGGPSTAVQLTGNVAQPGSYTKTDLQNDFTPVMSTISGDTYTGVPLWTFLDASDPMATDQVVITQVPTATRLCCHWRNSIRHWEAILMTCCPTPIPARIFQPTRWLGRSFPMTTSTAGGNRTWISLRLPACRSQLRLDCLRSP